MILSEGLAPSQHPELAAIDIERYTETFGQFLVHRTEKKVFGAERTLVLTYNPKTAKRQERIFDSQMRRVMKDAKAYFETIAKEPAAQVEPQMRTYLKTQKVGSSRAIRFYDFKVWHNGWKNIFSLTRKRSEVRAKKAAFGKKIVFTSMEDAPTDTILGYQKSGCQVENSFHHLKDQDLVAYYPGVRRVFIICTMPCSSKNSTQIKDQIYFAFIFAIAMDIVNANGPPTRFKKSCQREKSS